MLIAHRGESEDAPENTIAAVNLAWHRGADAVEIDVRLTADNRIVVIHDSNTRRVSGKYKSVRKTSSEELRKLSAGSFKGEKWSSEKIPFLNEVLRTVPGGKRIFIEIKCGKEILSRLKKDLKESGLPESQIVMIGFNFKLMTEVKKILQGVEVCWLADIERNGAFFAPAMTGMFVKKIMRSGLDGLDLKASRSINRENAAKIKKAGLNLYVWTVDSAAEAERLLNAGVDGVTTNRQMSLQSELTNLTKK